MRECSIAAGKFKITSKIRINLNDLLIGSYSQASSVLLKKNFYKFIMLLTSRDEIEDQERSGSGISRTDGDSEDVSRYGQTPLIGVWGWNFSHTSFEERGIAISPS